MFAAGGMPLGMLGAQGDDGVGPPADDGQLRSCVVANQTTALAQGLLVLGGDINEQTRPRKMLRLGASNGLGFDQRERRQGVHPWLKP